MASARLDVLIRPVANIYVQAVLGLLSVPAPTVLAGSVVSLAVFSRAASVPTGFTITATTGSAGVNQVISVNAAAPVN
jgi:hypothetical protein